MIDYLLVGLLGPISLGIYIKLYNRATFPADWKVILCTESGLERPENKYKAILDV